MIDGTDSAAAVGGRADSDDGAGPGGIALCLSNEAHGKSAFEIEQGCRASDGLLMMDVVFKMMNSVFKMMNVVLKMMNCAFKMHTHDDQVLPGSPSCYYTIRIKQTVI